MKQISVLGSTGSVGVSTLNVIEQNPDRFSVCALTAHRSVDALLKQCKKFRPAFAAIADERLGGELASGASKLGVETGAGADALAHAASLGAADAVMAAIVGGAGLAPTLAAAHAGKQVLLANKEALVMSGGLFVEACRGAGAKLLPIDSEHNAIFQCLPAETRLGERPPGVAKIVLTASGGPFRTWTAQQIAAATPQQACAHPNWDMGRKISVDSATLMNKGLEIIEARWLFGMPLADVEVLVHPQSVIHSMVQFLDGSMLAQLGQPDMRVPIAHAMAWPQRTQSGVDGPDMLKIGRLDFEAPDLDRFPALALAREAAAAGEGATIALNAANEVAVQRFLAAELGFSEIMQLIERVIDPMSKTAIRSLDDVFDCDRQARELAAAWRPNNRIAQ